MNAKSKEEKRYLLRRYSRGSIAFVELAKLRNLEHQTYEISQNELSSPSRTRRQFSDETDFKSELKGIQRSSTGIPISLNYSRSGSLHFKTIDESYSTSDEFEFHTINIRNSEFSSISNSKGYSVTLHDGVAVTINASKILHLIVRGAVSVVINNCEIGKISIINSINELAVLNSKVLQIDIPTEPKMHKVSLKGSNFATIPERERAIEEIEDSSIRSLLPVLDRQSYSNLVRWAESVGDSETAHLARGYELSIELAQATGATDKTVLVAWKLLGNFGLSPGRSILLILFFTVAFCIILFFSGTELDPSLAHGWLREHDGEDLRARFTRATFAGLNNLFSPISIFSPRKVINPSNELGAAAQLLHSILTLVLVVLTGFSIRRRFKMS